MATVGGMTLAFLAAEVTRLGDCLKYPRRPGGGVDLMSKADAEKLRAQFLEYSLELAQKVSEAIETMGDQYR